MKFSISFLICMFSVFIYQGIFADTLTTLDDFHTVKHSEKCMECHEDVADEYKKSSHSASMINPKVMSSFSEIFGNALSSKKMKIKSQCLTCHAPQIKDGSDELIEHIIKLSMTASSNKDIDKIKSAKQELQQISINCRVCHMMKALPGGNAKQNIIYGPGWDEHEHSHTEEFGYDTLKSEYLMSSDFCLDCHRNCPESESSSECSKLHKSKASHFKDTHTKTCHECHVGSSHSFLLISDGNELN